ncbi:MAG: hypothetical protein ACT6WE_25165, partial [Shinella sp.]
MGGLLGDAERLRDPRPGPALSQGRPHGTPLQSVREATERDHSRQGGLRVFGIGQSAYIDHSSTLVDDEVSVNDG